MLSMKNLLNGKNALFLLMLVFTLVLSACSGGGTEKTTNNEEGKDEGQAAEGQTHNFIVSHFLPGNSPIHTEVLEGLGADLGAQTDGRITLEIYPANALGDAGAHYDMAVTGEADIALSVYGYTPGRFPLVSIAEMPFFSQSAEHSSKVIHTLYEEFPEIQKEHDETVPLAVFTAEPAQLISAKYKIEKPEDLKGLRVRTPSPVGSSILEQLGATPVSMPMGEVYESLERGVIDVAMVPLETLQNYSFHEIAKYVTIANFSATPFYSVMNKETYNSLSDSDKEVLNGLTGMKLAEKAGSVFDADGVKGLELAKNGGAEIIEITGDKLTPWVEALKPISQKWIDDMNAKGYPGQEIYDRAMQLSEELK